MATCTATRSGWIVASSRGLVSLGDTSDALDGLAVTALHPSHDAMWAMVGGRHLYRVEGRRRTLVASLDDVVASIPHLLYCDDVQGPVNVVSPNPVTNRELTNALAAALGRPAFLRAPARAVRLLLGEMGSETALRGERGLRWLTARKQPVRLLHKPTRSLPLRKRHQAHR